MPVGKVPATRTKTTIGSIDTRCHTWLPMLSNTSRLAFQTSAGVLVLKVPLHFVLPFTLASLSS